MFFPTAGYVTDPQLSTHNLQRAAEAKGRALSCSTSKVVEILKHGDRVSPGCFWTTAPELHAPVVVNIAGPASAKGQCAMAGALGDMTIGTRALAPGSGACAGAPEGFDFFNTGAGDLGR